MATEDELWVPPLSSEDQKRLNRDPKRRTERIIKQQFADKTAWDWILLAIQLIGAIAIPFSIFFGLAQLRQQREQFASQQQTENQRATEAQDQRILQDYINHMSDLMLKNKLRNSKSDDDVRDVARAQTLTAIRGLENDRRRKALVLQFLHESKLINNKSDVISLHFAQLEDTDMSSTDRDLSNDNLSSLALNGANLSEAYLSNTDMYGTGLNGANLSGAYLWGANLSKALLHGANLSEANLNYFIMPNNQPTNLSGSDLRGANLSNANLSYYTTLNNQIISIPANLSNANLSYANLRGAILSNTNLSGANLRGAILSNTNLSGANLRGANLDGVNLSGANLKGATMPNGSKHP